MKKLLIVGFILLLAVNSVQAQEGARLHLAAQLAEALGFEKMMMQIKIQTQQSADQQFAQMMDQFNRSFSSMPPKYMNEIQSGSNSGIHIQN